MKVVNIKLENGEVFEIGGEYEFRTKYTGWKKGILYGAVQFKDYSLFKSGGYNNEFIRQIPKPEPKFKVGDKVKWSGQDPIISVIQRKCTIHKDSWDLGGTHSSCHESNLELYTPPEMIDLPEGIEFAATDRGKDNGDDSHFSIGILFNGYQELYVNNRRKSYGVFIHRDSFREEELLLHKPDYCLIESTMEECSKVGIVSCSAYLGKLDNIEDFYEEKEFWHIGLGGKKRTSFIELGNGVREEDITDYDFGNETFYKLVKRSEVS